jgi:hypothetical protein
VFLRLVMGRVSTSTDSVLSKMGPKPKTSIVKSDDIVGCQWEYSTILFTTL